MKTLLFVQTGDGRPKCVRERVLRYADGSIMWGPRWCDAKALADRWWLVECENAAAGRWTIACHLGLGSEHALSAAEGGRILASGGRS